MAMAMAMAMGGSCRMRPPFSRIRVTSHLISSMIQTFFFKPTKNITVSHPHFIASSSFSSSVSPISTSSFSPISHKPQIPLFLRPLIYSTTLLDLHNFFVWAKTLASSVGSTFVEIDNGPDSSLLLRELNWFLEDTIQDSSLISHLGTSQIDGLSSKTVGLRASLDQMYKLWQQRIEERRPFQYIVGCEHWRDLLLSVEEGVLIPRPETEKIVTLVEDVVCTNEALKEGIWADLGTGSGALAIAISRILGNSGRVFAIDLSPIAVSVASYNVERYALQDVIKVKQGSWFEPLMEFEGQLAGLVSNPPYIPSEDINGLQAEVGKYEPVLALDGGVEGMDSLFHICSTMSIMLKPGGFFVFETNGVKQCQVLADYLQNATGNGFCDVTIVPDFAGVRRFVIGHRR
ncbi:uncharacterized protein LOC130818203 [Amaranthus tricolor]|uniref:uncharacterized protein LOC130818203 n=1 Tax=Amaranthus tricolor TaxID=29722 RepID=UPI002585A481|nr:uncharacterized protein LOC130818203 [Amaranthus tricolor]XP_057540256.1 uncharacterized protein LOC130818203 [Amaranthus tricolor]XP_057540257.1 uncharacterized protein LOC130818203 [Amaranthus tricolor]XP_057540258.1 uncharacterized protein LOC130818203 [Amaranthus tricolor]XP_057540259.1 uncharacterized protein LOC130818203 [Amaranthus tricolor]